jgi:Kef-type K+ transport system membrane component KefB/mannitol/fructose-specific phosphotransferase system IIA component (Ntr-type)
MPWFEEASPLLMVAVVLICGLGGGALTRRLRLPAITGQILVGILIGPSVLDLFGVRENPERLESLEPLMHFALGLVAVTVGSHLNLARLRNAFKRLSLLLLLESVLTPLLILAAVSRLPGVDLTLGVLLAAVGISTAPATVVAIVAETRSRGVFVKTLIAAVALNNIACILLFEVARVAAKVGGGEQQWIDVALAPLSQLLLAAVLGGAAGAILVGVTWRVVRTDLVATASLVAILLTSGLADLLGVSSLLSCLFLGVTLANLTPSREEIGDAVFEDFEMAILAVFFTVAGMDLDFRYLAAAGIPALVVFLARATGKVVSARVAMRWAGATDPVRRWLGWALLPQAGVAVGLMLLVQEDEAFGSIRDLFLAVVLTWVILNEIVGPITTRVALKRSGDAGKDRERLIDFLHEEHIVVGLGAESWEDAVRELSRVLIRSHHLDADPEEIAEAVIAREREASTSLGKGLAIPHCNLPEGEAIAGVMGISRDGIRADTRDGEPLRCIVLLATPRTERDRHLEVISAFVRSIGSNRNIRRQLYDARSAAHAHDLLHAEDFTDFNYFLEDSEA